METFPYNHRISIVIVTCNSLPALADSLEGLAACGDGTFFELIVVDNQSSDGSVACVKRHFPGATVIELKENIGFAAACNQAAWAASGEYLLFHNPDLRLDAGAIEQLIKACESQERFGAGGGRLRFPDGSFQATCRRFPTMANILFSRGSVASKVLSDKGKYTLDDSGGTSEVPAVAGTLMIIRRELFLAINGFDERYFMYMEDTDLCLRLNSAGYINYFVPAAGGVHLWGQGSRAGQLRRNWYHHISLWKYFLKHFPSAGSLLILPFVLMAHLLMVSIFGNSVRR